MQGDFNHMSNIITVLFEQVIWKSNNSDSETSDWHSVKGISLLLFFIYLIFILIDEKSKLHRIFTSNEITKYEFFETVYQVTSVLGQTHPWLISALIMIDKFSVKNPSFKINRNTLKRWVTQSFISSINHFLLDSLSSAWAQRVKCTMISISPIRVGDN